MAYWTSPRPSGRTFPISLVTSSPSSCFLFCRSSAALKMISPLLGAGTRRHDSYAFLAASTALSTSSLPDLGTIPTTSYVSAGFTLSRVFPDTASTQSPFIRFFIFSGIGTSSYLLKRIIQVLFQVIHILYPYRDPYKGIRDTCLFPFLL